MSDKISINGVVCDPAEASIPAMDHGFLFGDSVYETLRTYGGRFFRFEAHLERLASSAEALELELPLSVGAFRERCEDTLRAAGETEAALRLVVTRGVGPMDLDPSRCGVPNVLVYVRPRPRYPAGAYREGLSLAIVERERNRRQSLDPNVKSGNYLNNVLALVEARKAGAYEGIMLNARGLVTEGTTSNVFVVRDGQVRTPPISVGLLSGITRREVLALCEAAGLPHREEAFPPEELRAADEVFITSSMKQVMPISRIDGEPVGSGAVGPVTTRLLAAYREAVRAETGVEPEIDP